MPEVMADTDEPSTVTVLPSQLTVNVSCPSASTSLQSKCEAAALSVNILSSRRAAPGGVCEAAEAPGEHDNMATKHSNAAATERIDSEVMRFMVNIYCRKEDIKYKCTQNPSVGKKTACLRR